MFNVHFHTIFPLLFRTFITTHDLFKTAVAHGPLLKQKNEGCPSSGGLLDLARADMCMVVYVHNRLGRTGWPFIPRPRDPGQCDPEFNFMIEANY